MDVLLDKLTSFELLDLLQKAAVRVGSSISSSTADVKMASTPDVVSDLKPILLGKDSDHSGQYQQSVSPTWWSSNTVTFNNAMVRLFQLKDLHTQVEQNVHSFNQASAAALERQLAIGSLVDQGHLKVERLASELRDAEFALQEHRYAYAQALSEAQVYLKVKNTTLDLQLSLQKDMDAIRNALSSVSASLSSDERQSVAANIKAASEYISGINTDRDMDVALHSTNAAQVKGVSSPSIGEPFSSREVSMPLNDSHHSAHHVQVKSSSTTDSRQPGLIQNDRASELQCNANSTDHSHSKTCTSERIEDVVDYGCDTDDDLSVNGIHNGTSLVETAPVSQQDSTENEIPCNANSVSKRIFPVEISNTRNIHESRKNNFKQSEKPMDTLRSRRSMVGTSSYNSTSGNRDRSSYNGEGDYRSLKSGIVLDTSMPLRKRQRSMDDKPGVPVMEMHSSSTHYRKRSPDLEVPNRHQISSHGRGPENCLQWNISQVIDCQVNASCYTDIIQRVESKWFLF
ncbi:hypothetical protein RTP6_005165 [Batrachochytrium dendrobatidis]